jgi:hypothetical protein
MESLRRRMCAGALLLCFWAGEGKPSDVRDVSLVQIIAEPKPFDGLDVRLVGAFQFEREEQALYLHAEDREFRNELNAVWVEVQPELVETAKALSGCAVIVEGRLSARERGHLGGYAATLRDTRRIVRALSRAELHKRRIDAPGCRRR